MAFDPDKLPSYVEFGNDYAYLGVAGGVITPSDTVDLTRYARVRVWIPITESVATIRHLPAANPDVSPITLSLTPGTAYVLEYVVRRVFVTGTTASAVIHGIW